MHFFHFEESSSGHYNTSVLVPVYLSIVPYLYQKSIGCKIPGKYRFINYQYLYRKNSGFVSPVLIHFANAKKVRFRTQIGQKFTTHEDMRAVCTVIHCYLLFTSFSSNETVIPGKNCTLEVWNEVYFGSVIVVSNWMKMYQYLYRESIKIQFQNVSEKISDTISWKVSVSDTSWKVSLNILVGTPISFLKSGVGERDWISLSHHKQYPHESIILIDLPVVVSAILTIH